MFPTHLTHRPAYPEMLLTILSQKTPLRTTVDADDARDSAAIGAGAVGRLASSDLDRRHFDGEQVARVIGRLVGLHQTCIHQVCFAGNEGRAAPFAQAADQMRTDASRSPRRWAATSSGIK